MSRFLEVAIPNGFVACLLKRRQGLLWSAFLRRLRIVIIILGLKHRKVNNKIVSRTCKMPFKYSLITPMLVSALLSAV